MLILSAGVLLAGLDWGLPSRAADEFLFGQQPPWTGRQIVARSAPAPADSSRASDVDANPLDRRQPVIVNATDAQRAEIVRRYRLFTYQPDEMQTPMALAAMKPGEGDFDPRMYKYGGLWIYPVAVLLKIASMLGLIDLRSDLSFYLDHPDAFARFYVIARLYVVAWALVGAWAAMAIVRRLTPGLLASLAAGVCFVFMPVVINVAHEAKPHLPGAVLVMLTILAGMKYLETARRRWLWLAGALCGAAVGMVLSAWAAFAVLLAIALVRRRETGRVAGAALIGIIVYLATNPYVAINLVANPAVIRSNLANSAAFYQASLSGLANAAKLTRIGTSSLLAIAGLVGAVAWVAAYRQQALGALIVAPALAAAAPFFLFAFDQPPDYARFALTLDIALMIAALAIIGRIRSPAARASTIVVLTLTTVLSGGMLLRGFVLDRHAIVPGNSRLEAARELERWKQIDGYRRLVIFAEPAPYCLPPVDLWHWQIILMPRNATLREAMHAGGDLVVSVDDEDRVDPAGTRISWASKRFAIIPARSPAPRTLPGP